MYIKTQNRRTAVKDITPGEALRKRGGLLGQLENMLTGRQAGETLEALGRFLRKDENPWKTPSRNELYVLAGEEVITGEAPFVAKNRFVIDESPSASVKIGYMNEAFRVNFLPLIEERPGAARFVAYEILRGTEVCITDRNRDNAGALLPLTELGCSSGALLAHIWELLRKQRDGNHSESAEGMLCVYQSYTNVFYAYGVDQHLWALCLTWGYSDEQRTPGHHDTGWGIFALPIGRALVRRLDCRIFVVAR